MAVIKKLKAVKIEQNHLLGIQDISFSQVSEILQQAKTFITLNKSDSKKIDILRGKTQINLFFEPSTRTQSSFELAGKRLGADVMSMNIVNSAIKKGETLIDTAMTLNAMHPDIIVIRHQDSGAPNLLSQKVNCAVINAGDGRREHPTQALLDSLTIINRKGKVEGLKIAICGDILHSRVARSNIYFRGNSIVIKGDQASNELVKKAVEFLTHQFKTYGTIEKKDIISSMNKFMVSEENNKNLYQLDYIIKTPKRTVIPRSKKQKDYIRALKESDIVISNGPAGTGKTYLAVAVALTMLLEKKIDRIILSRPAVEAGERLGFLPGDMKDKVDPYLRPLYDSLYDLLDYEKIQKKIEIGDIEIAPVAFMRGRTLKNSFAILDEAQNATDIQIKMFLTRIGENSKIVVNGDSSQIDLINKNHSGLLRSKDLLKNLDEISVVDFDHTDVVRHSLVTKIVKAYDDFKND